MLKKLRIDGPHNIMKLPMAFLTSVYCPETQPCILVATGFGGNGMTYGTLTALVMKSILLKEEDPLIKLFSPSRLKPIAGFKSFVAHNADVLKEVMGKFFSSNPSEGFADLARTEGKIMDFDDWKIGIVQR